MRCQSHVDALKFANASACHDRGRRGCHSRAAGQDCEGKTNHSILCGQIANVEQYFKSIEQVAASQGFGQALASEELVLKKRDSVLEKLDSPRSPTAKSFLAPPKPELTRQITPELVPDSMHTRLPERPNPGVDGLEMKELPLSAMHERVDSPRA